MRAAFNSALNICMSSSSRRSHYQQNDFESSRNDEFDCVNFDDVLNGASFKLLLAHTGDIHRKFKYIVIELLLDEWNTHEKKHFMQITRIEFSVVST